MHDAVDAKVDKLKRQLDFYIENARDNELKLRRFQKQELQFIKSAGLEELLESFFFNYRHRFKHDAVSLLLLDPDYEVRRILDNLGIEQQRYPELHLSDSADVLTSMFGHHLRPLLGAEQPRYNELLFTGQARPLLSIAAFPLIRQKRLIGSFNIGSLRSERYTKHSATDFLQRMVEIFAVCFENAVNNEKIKLLGLLDPLTGVHNRRYFDQRLAEEISRALRQHKPLSFLFLDIDHFKAFNDNYGHQLGDRVLQSVAGMIKSQMRLSDVLSRFGGEEFAILLTNTAEKEALEIAERIRQNIENLNLEVDENSQLGVTLSAGCSTLEAQQNQHYHDALGNQLLAAADAALYSAKEEGRNRVCFRALARHDVATC
ncbi:MAG TPA: sensor domain-containing diguanylate cyclase [Gammaproteobacteria bacterium]|nr:sensor domain-containing diguanylate cyclase [Gammaproteobacteria bacterium]